MKLTRCDYCGKELLEEYYYTTTYPVYTMGGWAGDKHFCSPFCVSEYFYELDEKAKEKKTTLRKGVKNEKDFAFYCGLFFGILSNVWGFVLSNTGSTSNSYFYYCSTK